MSKEIFVIVGPPTTAETELLRSEIKDDLDRWLATARNFKKAYEMAMFFGDIKNPHLSYRQALTRYKDDGAVFLSDESDPAHVKEEHGRVLISTIKLY